MMDLGTKPIASTDPDHEECEPMTDEARTTPRAGDDFEQVVIESVCVGDYVLLDPGAPSNDARCVLAKRAKVNERTARIIGWLLELTDGHVAWWSHGEPVWRRRIGAHRMRDR